MMTVVTWFQLLLLYLSRLALLCARCLAPQSCVIRENEHQS